MMRAKLNNIRLIFFVDAAIVVFSIVTAYILRFNFSVPEREIENLFYVVPVVLLVRMGGFFFFNTYAGMIRYTSIEDAKNIFLAVAMGSFLFTTINFISVNFFSERFFIPFSIIIIEFIFTSFFLMAIRMFARVMFVEFRASGKEKKRVIIYGAGETGVITKRSLERDVGAKYSIIGFFDDNKTLANKKIEGVQIYNDKDKLIQLLSEHVIDWLIISTANLPAARKQDVVDICLQHKVRVLTVPPMSKWINGELSFKQIKKIKIEDLLQRDPIKLHTDKIAAELQNKRILVTGAAGSIGSEIVRQLVKFKPQQVILLDQAESPLYELELELTEKVKIKNYVLLLGDICNLERMEHLFQTYKPEVVFHAAAYKHVPVMEQNPCESIKTNVLGTKLLADLSVKYGVEKFVMISTDKAVNPTSVMGASKRIAEIYVQSLNKKLQHQHKKRITRFITTRFGNVLGSNGSVIQLFRKQIESGGPITVTHPDVTRYFMTIPEACQLVLEAGTLGEGGEIFIFDMGKLVKIVDLAKKMVVLSGLELGKDINLVFTNLRPGEKLYEELLNDKENTLPTHHNKIMIAKVREYDYSEVEQHLDELEKTLFNQDNDVVVSKMKEIVPAFISKNSEFELLDRKINKAVL